MRHTGTQAQHACVRVLRGGTRPQQLQGGSRQPHGVLPPHGRGAQLGRRPQARGGARRVRARLQHWQGQHLRALWRALLNLLNLKQAVAALPRVSVLATGEVWRWVLRKRQGGRCAPDVAVVSVAFKYSRIRQSLPRNNTRTQYWLPFVLLRGRLAMRCTCTAAYCWHCAWRRHGHCTAIPCRRWVRRSLRFAECDVGNLSPGLRGQGAPHRTRCICATHSPKTHTRSSAQTTVRVG
jgi:hypothetical protein